MRNHRRCRHQSEILLAIVFLPGYKAVKAILASSGGKHMGTPRPHGGSVRVLNGHANRKPANRRPRLMGKIAAEPNTALGRLKKLSRRELSHPVSLPLDEADIEQMADVPND